MIGATHFNSYLTPYRWSTPCLHSKQLRRENTSASVLNDIAHRGMLRTQSSSTLSSSSSSPTLSKTSSSSSFGCDDHDSPDSASQGLREPDFDQEPYLRPLSNYPDSDYDDVEIVDDDRRDSQLEETEYFYGFCPAPKRKCPLSFLSCFNDFEDPPHLARAERCNEEFEPCRALHPIPETDSSDDAEEDQDQLQHQETQVQEAPWHKHHATIQLKLCTEEKGDEEEHPSRNRRNPFFFSSSQGSDPERERELDGDNSAAHDFESLSMRVRRMTTAWGITEREAIELVFNVERAQSIVC